MQKLAHLYHIAANVLYLFNYFIYLFNYFMVQAIHQGSVGNKYQQPFCTLNCILIYILNYTVYIEFSSIDMGGCNK